MTENLLAPPFFTMKKARKAALDATLRREIEESKPQSIQGCLRHDKAHELLRDVYHLKERKSRTSLINSAMDRLRKRGVTRDVTTTASEALGLDAATHDDDDHNDHIGVEAGSSDELVSAAPLVLSHADDDADMTPAEDLQENAVTTDALAEMDVTADMPHLEGEAGQEPTEGLAAGSIDELAAGTETVPNFSQPDDDDDMPLAEDLQADVPGDELAIGTAGTAETIPNLSHPDDDADMPLVEDLQDAGPGDELAVGTAETVDIHPAEDAAMTTVPRAEGVPAVRRRPRRARKTVNYAEEIFNAECDDEEHIERIPCPPNRHSSKALPRLADDQRLFKSKASIRRRLHPGATTNTPPDDACYEIKELTALRVIQVRDTASHRVNNLRNRGMAAWRTFEKLCECANEQEVRMGGTSRSMKRSTANVGCATRAHAREQHEKNGVLELGGRTLAGSRGLLERCFRRCSRGEEMVPGYYYEDPYGESAWRNWPRS